MPTGRRRNPLVLVSTAAVVDNVLSRSCSELGQENEVETDLGLKSPSTALTAGLLLWNGRNSLAECSSVEDESTAIIKLLERRGGGNEIAAFDELTTVGVSASLLRRLSLSSGAWVILRETSTNLARPARVVVLDPPGSPEPAEGSPHELSNTSEGVKTSTLNGFPVYYFADQNPTVDDCVAYLSPVLALNLGIHVSWLEFLTSSKPDQKHEDENLQNQVEKPTARKSLAETPSWCHSIIISPFLPILETPLSENKSLVNEYLTGRRLPRLPRIKHASHMRIGMVLALEPSTEPFLCVSHNHTALVLAGSLATQLPPLTRSARLHKVFLRTPAVRQLSQLLAPCLHPRVTPLELRLAVLIHGPSGSGKQTVVRLAAEDLGVNVLEFNCYDFVGATEGKTTAALVEAFKSAKRYSPSILLLRRFEALAKSSSGGTSPGHQQGAVSRVTSVLKTCIQVHLPNTIQEDDVSTNLWTDEDESTGPESKEFGSIPLKFAGIGHGLREGLVLVVAACESAENLTPSFRRCFTHELAVGMPDEDQRLAILHHYLGRRERDTTDDTLEESLKLIASQTSGLTPRDLRSVAADTGAAAITRLIQDGLYSEKEIFSSKLESHPILEPKNESKFTGESYPSDEDKDADMRDLVRLTSRDLEKVLERVKLRTASAIGTPKVPNVKWEDVGGLEDVKKAILDTVQLPLQHRELFASGLRQRSGVLLYGPPGTGKTLLAKAVATECSLNFLSVKGPELINMYIGESEKNVREIFHKARAARPCVVFFDELDALAPARGASGDSGGVMDRVVSQLLAEIDGVSDNSQDLFIIGASNRPDLIDPALLRPGRFDKLFELDLFISLSEVMNSLSLVRVLQALTRKFILDKNVSLKALSERCPVNYTGADMYALCADAWHQAVKREVSKSERRRGGSSDNVIDEVVVKQEDFMKNLIDTRDLGFSSKVKANGSGKLLPRYHESVARKLCFTEFS
ncbi:hypothetical protein AXG93_4421s1090 [Marchantia polymorpha subsp. ruderalis]|uniref:Peroxisomal ATPase PEX6 n=1 Tax=Marchantia polymorpha subsp. ruderalis TaxID=1480154 RepID=A0A176WFE4_MARPO|nr:hypothetical protein AXG93_4421s1090 [Marchantia polymorpha subsp. ruderalis]